MSSPQTFTNPPDLAAWRKERRRELLALREALSPEERRAGDARIGELLLAGFPMLAAAVIGFYWPIRGEVDPRVALHRLRQRGARTGLPVVVAKGQPLQFREWRPDTPTTPGPMDLPIPQDTEVLVPDAVLVPPVGFDARGYRLGYGAGFFDRTLAAANPRPLALGLARAVSRMETIRPQPWDLPMDFILTEEGIHVTEPGGLRLLEDPAEAAAIAARLQGARREVSTEELAALLNTLLEAERAGAAVLAAYARQLDLDPWALGELRRMQRDEAHNCGVLIGLLAHLGRPHSRATGAFLEKALAVRGAGPRLEFLSRGQAWVEKRIAAVLPRIADARVRRALDAMRISHSANIATCDALLAGTPGPLASSNGA